MEPDLNMVINELLGRITQLTLESAAYKVEQMKLTEQNEKLKKELTSLKNKQVEQK